jgi:hypothetical protein
LGTIEELKTMRVELVERRHAETYALASEYSHDQMVALAAIQTAITAVDAVIAEGRNFGQAHAGSIYEREDLKTLGWLQN